MEQKNFILAIGLIASFLILWSVFVVPRFTPPPPPVTAGQPETASPATLPTPVIKSAHAAMGEPIAQPDFILRDENNEIVFSPRGGAVKNWRLKLKGQEVDLVLNPDADVLPLATFPDVAFKISSRDRQVVMTATLANRVRVINTFALTPTG